jgi:hypothetical protein
MAVCIPILVALGNAITECVQQKNWSAIVSFVLDYMAQAENLFEKGADRKAWVMEMLDEVVIQLNYPYDDDARIKVSAMIDDICDASRIINSEVRIIGNDTHRD